MNAELLQSQIVEYSSRNQYIAEHFAVPKCECCNCQTFKIVMNEEEGVAARICNSCDTEHGIGNSDDFIDEVEEVYPIECTCGSKEFEIMAGVSLYSDSEDVRWFYFRL